MADPIPWREIPLAAVDLKDHTFAVPGEFDLTRLIASFKEVGLINPPWLRAKGERWQVVSGFKRFQAAVRLGWKTIPARTLPATAAESQCLLVALHDNAFSRSFNLLEQAVWARRLLDYWDQTTVAGKFLPYLGLPPSPAFLARLLQVTALEPRYQELCAQGRLALTAAATLAEWQEADRAAAWPFLAGLPFSQSKQEQFLQGVEILARREGASPREILSRKQISQSLIDQALTPAERAETVRRCLKNWLNPRLEAALNAFQEALGRLGLRGHPRLLLKPPPAFEGPDFQLKIKFRDASELRGLAEEIARLSGQEDFSHLTDL